MILGYPRGIITKDDEPEPEGLRSTPAARGAGLGLGRLRCALLGISPSEASFSVRGFRPAEPGRQQRLELIGRTFIAGYNAAVTHGDGEVVAEQLSCIASDLRGFAAEGAAMGLALLDLLSPWPARRFARFAAGPARNYVYLAYVGAGWALARTSRRLVRRLGSLDPLISWLMLDGHGFHEGYFRATETIDLQRRPRSLSGYAARAFDQGLGRSIWFAKGASADRVAAAADAF